MKLGLTPDDNPMDHNDRIPYAEMAIDYEWHSIGNVLYVPEEKWEAKFLNRVDVDPLNVHKPYGLIVPQLVNDTWTIGVCVPLLLRPVAYCSEQDMGTWLEYWIVHMGLHIVILDWAVHAGESNLPLVEIERRVTDEIESQDSHLHQFAEKVKSLKQME